MRRFIPRIDVSISIVAATIVFTQSAQAQKFTVLHSFTGGQDGSQPMAGVTMDKAGNLYGTAQVGGAGYGTVFRLKQYGSGWIFTPFFTFGGNDGAYPYARVVIGPNGSLYGTTYQGGSWGSGAVFNLRPPPHASPNVLGSWLETVLYSFAGDGDGGNPGFGDLAFDQAGNLYGTTIIGGEGYGTVYELTPSDGGWTESIVYSFAGGKNDGSWPYAGVVFGKSGNLYGTTYQGGAGTGCGSTGCGTVYELTPSQSGWVENILYSFQSSSDGAAPAGGLIFDDAGNLYGATSDGGPAGGGTVFELSPSNGTWSYTVLFAFPGPGNGPWSTLAWDQAGNLYGTTASGGLYSRGTVFRLKPSNGGWVETDLYEFTGADDGAFPLGSATLDSSGNIYGTTRTGGDFNDCYPYGCGVVWEITP
jgi:uncharacterized repeat protein (TIGR03803 family)